MYQDSRRGPLGRESFVVVYYTFWFGLDKMLQRLALLLRKLTVVAVKGVYIRQLATASTSYCYLWLKQIKRQNSFIKVI